MPKDIIFRYLNQGDCMLESSCVTSRDDDEDKRGSITGYSVISAGEAIGHGFWIDSETLDQVVALGNSNSKIFKSRANHPSMCAPGFGSFLGRSTNFRREGNRVLADFHGSLAADPAKLDHLYKMAKHEPSFFGASVVVRRNRDAELAFAAANNRDGSFISPDPENKKNLSHMRVSALKAVDFVDSPAANADGLFSENLDDEEVLAGAGELVDFVFGLRAEAPELSFLGIEPTRVRGFVRQHLKEAGITYKKEKAMPENSGQAEAENKRPENENSELRERITRIREEFKEDPGFALEQIEKGASLLEARAAYVEVLRAKNEKLQAQLKSRDESSSGQTLDTSIAQPKGSGQGDGDFIKLAKARAKERGIPLHVAMSELSEERPELYKKYDQRFEEKQNQVVASLTSVGRMVRGQATFTE